MVVPSVAPVTELRCANCGWPLVKEGRIKCLRCEGEVSVTLLDSKGKQRCPECKKKGKKPAVLMIDGKIKCPQSRCGEIERNEVFPSAKESPRRGDMDKKLDIREVEFSLPGRIETIQRKNPESRRGISVRFVGWSGYKHPEEYAMSDAAKVCVSLLGILSQTSFFEPKDIFSSIGTPQEDLRALLFQVLEENCGYKIRVCEHCDLFEEIPDAINKTGRCLLGKKIENCNSWVPKERGKRTKLFCLHCSKDVTMKMAEPLRTEKCPSPKLLVIKGTCPKCKRDVSIHYTVRYTQEKLRELEGKKECSIY